MKTDNGKELFIAVLVLSMVVIVVFRMLDRALVAFIDVDVKIRISLFVNTLI